MPTPIPSLEYEYAFWRRGYCAVAGMDEAGRGAWAGPVVAGVVILPRVRHIQRWWTRAELHALARVRDSKLISPTQRTALIEPICQTALGYATGFASPEEIDTLGIVPATRLAMQRALAALPLAPDALLIDALVLETQVPQQAIIHGDQLVLSIACASILAKVTRDRLMSELDALYPGYGLAQHKGYGTAAHRAALDQLGSSNIHRHSFAPIKTRAHEQK